MAAPPHAKRRLYAAVLALAAEGPIEQFTATDIARAAGVHRSTFAEYATSGADLLRAALREQLDDIRARFLTGPGASAPEAATATTRGVLAHVEEHHAIYHRGLVDVGGGDLHGMLAEHFRDSVRELEIAGAVHPPFDAPGASRQFLEESTARFIASGSIGILEAWLREPAPRNPDHFVAAFDALTAAARS